MGTVALVVVTGVYAFLTYALVRQARKSAKAASESAAAMERHTAIAELALPVSFSAHYHYEGSDDPSQYEPGFQTWLVVKALATLVHVHEVVMYGGAVYASGDDKDFPKLMFGGNLEFLNPRIPPVRLNRGEELICNWPGPLVDRRREANFATVVVSYSFYEKGPIYSIQVGIAF